MSFKSNVSRRRFLARLGAAGMVAPALKAATPASAQTTPPRPASSVLVGKALKPLLQPSDFSYIGSFRMPASIGGGDPVFGTGLAHRWVNGQLRFLSRAHPNPPPARIYEVAAPPLEMVPAASRPASLVKVWGDIVGADSFGSTLGLYWDEPDQRLYWTTGNMYNATSPFDPSVGFTMLDDQNGTFARQGVWGFNGRSCKMAMGGVLSIPKWFSDAFCPGRRLGAGCGGYFSIATTGPISMGPALTAFSPASLPTAANRSSVAHTPLVGYPFNAVAYTSPDRCHRDVDYATEFDGWKVRNGVGYWSWSDYIWQGGVWIDTPTKSGLFFFPTMSHGRTWYANSTLNAERGSHWWYEYDPVDLGHVAEGKKQQWQIQPAKTWAVPYPDISYPTPQWRDEPRQHVVGSTYDATTQILYIAVRLALWTSGSPIIVYAYQVA